MRVVRFHASAQRPTLRLMAAGSQTHLSAFLPKPPNPAETLVHLKKIFTPTGHRSRAMLPHTLKRFKIIPNLNRELLFWTFTNDEALAWFLYSRESEVPQLLKKTIRTAVLQGDYVLAQQCSIRSTIAGVAKTGLAGRRTKNTFACFIGKKGQEEFTLLLKMAMMENHWLAWAMYQESLIFDLRRVELQQNGSIDVGSVDIYRMDGGLVPSPFFHINTRDKIPGSRNGEVHLEEIILHELVPDVRERKMTRRETERESWNQALEIARRDDFFHADALGKGLARIFSFAGSEGRIVFFLRGIALPDRVGNLLLKRLSEIPNGDKVKKVSIFYHQGNLRVRLESSLPLDGKRHRQLHFDITTSVAKFLSYHVMSDTHVDAGGPGSEHHEIPGRSRRLVSAINACTEAGSIWVGNGDVLDFWREPWHSIRDFRGNKPFFEALAKTYGYAVIGNHDLAAAVDEIQVDFPIKLGIEQVRFSHSLRFFTDAVYITHGHNGDFPYNFGPGLFNRGKRVAWIGKQFLNLFPWATSGSLEKAAWQFCKTTAALLQHQYFHPFNEIMRMQRNWDHALDFLNDPHHNLVDFSAYSTPGRGPIFGVLEGTMGEAAALRGVYLREENRPKPCALVRHIQGHRHSMKEVPTINQLLWQATVAEGLLEERVPVHYQSGSWTGKPMGSHFGGYKEGAGLLSLVMGKIPHILSKGFSALRLSALKRHASDEWVTVVKPRVLDYPSEDGALEHIQQTNHFPRSGSE